MKDKARFHAVCDSPIGPLAVAWSERGLVGVHLPESTRARTERRLAQRAGSTAAAPPPWVKRAIRGLQALAGGRPADLDRVPLDDAGIPPFHGRVYAALRQVPRGATCTYGELARAAGRPLAARAVGGAMRRNPWPLIVPCHRVLAAGDRLGGFSASGGVALKAELLRAEQRTVKPPVASRTVRAKAPASGARKAEPAVPRAGFDTDAALEHLRASDKRLAALIERVPFTLEPAPQSSTFEALLRTIVYQQLNGKAAATIHGRVLALLPAGPPDARALLAIPPERLCGAGLSRAKTAAVLDLAARTAAGDLPEFDELAGLADEEIVERLSVVRGIGRWSVEMLLLFWLRRPDVLPLGDFGVRQGFMHLLARDEPPAPEELERHARRWRPYRSVASWYLWRALDEARARQQAVRAGR